MLKIKYINNDVNSGIAYDWKAIIKAYKKLGIPKEYDYTEILPLENDAIKWHVLNSERSVGKTTNILLLGMVQNMLYGTQIQLIRHSSKEQKASYFERLFSTIVEYKNGHYIKSLTDGKYNTVVYWHKAFYYGYTDENGKVIKCETPFCIALCSSDCYTLCSTYENPKGDFIVLDECFNETNTADEFIHFIHLHKTIVRERISDKIFILGNNLDINNIWYRQLTIQNEIRKMKRGETRILHTPEGMPIFTAFLENNLPTKRKVFNALHYGFNNSELNSITGSGEWKMKQYPQICEIEAFDRIGRGVFISYHDDLFLEIEIAVTDNDMIFLVHPANRNTAIKGDILYTMYTPKKSNEKYFTVTDKFTSKLYKAIKEKRIYYSDNETGNLFEKFYRETVRIT